MKNIVLGFLLLPVLAVAAAPVCRHAPVPKAASGVQLDTYTELLNKNGWKELKSEGEDYYRHDDTMPSWCNMISQCWAIFQDKNSKAVLALYTPDGVQGGELYCPKSKKPIKIIYN